MGNKTDFLRPGHIYLYIHQLCTYKLNKWTCIIIIYEYLIQLQNEPTYFNLTVTACPAGHELHEIQSSNEVKDHMCECNSDHDDNIVDCVPDKKKLVLKVCTIIPSYLSFLIKLQCGCSHLCSWSYFYRYKYTADYILQYF